MKESDQPQPASSSDFEFSRAESLAKWLALHATGSSAVLARSEAEQEFDRARQQAFIRDALSFLRYDPSDLLPFETVRERLGLGEKIYRGVQSILLNKIVGSVGRYNDFTRTFLPRAESMRSRWQQVDQLSTAHGMPPIQVYQVGQVYFVLDGNHRVSIARQAGADAIEAHVWEYETRVPLEPDDALEDILIRQEYLEFLDHTKLDKHRPDQYIILTSPGRYRDFEEQITIHRHYMELECGCNVPFEEAAEHWYDHVYCPIVEVIHREDMLSLFPGRTEADLVNWIVCNQGHLRQRYGDRDVSAKELAEEAADLAHGNLWRRFRSWFLRKILRWPVYTGVKRDA